MMSLHISNPTLRSVADAKSKRGCLFTELGFSSWISSWIPNSVDFLVGYLARIAYTVNSNPIRLRLVPLLFACR